MLKLLFNGFKTLKNIIEFFPHKIFTLRGDIELFDLFVNIENLATSI